MRKLNPVLASISLFLLTATAFAASQNPFERSLQARQGGVHGGGGDVVTEKRIKDIRDNLADFIARGGDKGLDFRGRLTLSDYEDGNVAKDIFSMKLVLQEGAVTVNAIQNQDSSDELKNTYVDGALKICKGVFEAKRDGLPYIICDAKAFGKMDPDAEKNADLQTVQIAHEYHALAGIERNYGSDSAYWLSDQLREYMGYERVRRLLVPAAQSKPNQTLPSVGGDHDAIVAAKALELHETLVKESETRALGMLVKILKRAKFEVENANCANDGTERMKCRFGVVKEGLHATLEVDPIEMVLSGSDAGPVIDESYSKVVQPYRQDAVGNVIQPEIRQSVRKAHVSYYLTGGLKTDFVNADVGTTVLAVSKKDRARFYEKSFCFADSVIEEGRVIQESHHCK